MKSIATRSTAILVVFLSLQTPAIAYIGPGLGLDAIGMVIGLVFAFFMLLLGAVWYPLKKLFKSFRNQPKPELENHPANTPANTNASDPR